MCSQLSYLDMELYHQGTFLCYLMHFFWYLERGMNSVMQYRRPPLVVSVLSQCPHSCVYQEQECTIIIREKTRRWISSSHTHCCKNRLSVWFWLQTRDDTAVTVAVVTAAATVVITPIKKCIRASILTRTPHSGCVSSDC